MNYTIFNSYKPEAYPIQLHDRSPWILSPLYKEYYGDGCSSQSYCCLIQDILYHKAILFNDKIIANKIINSEDPSTIANLEKVISNVDNTIWDKNKYTIIRNACYNKFRWSSRETEEAFYNARVGKFIYANPYDRVLGIGYSEKDALKNINNWGENLLGKALDEISLLI